MSARDSTPVLIVGGGPSGLACAAELALHGVECMIIEPRTEVSLDRPRAKTTSVRTMEHFRRWGIADAVRAAAPFSPEWSDSVVFCDAVLGQELTRFTGCFGLTISPDERFAEGGQQIPQPLVERVLREHVQSQPMVTTLWGGRVEQLDEDAAGVTATVITREGDRRSIRADWVLGCDGSNGIVRRLLGIDYLGHSDPRSNFNMVFRAAGLEPAMGDAVQYWVVGQKTSGLVGRLDLDGTWWAIAPGVAAAEGAARSEQILADLLGADLTPEVLSTDPWTARMLVADQFRSGRLFLVGDAAHLNPPWGGHGYNTCVGDAVNLCWKLAAVLHGWAEAALLDSYELERRPVVTDTVALAEANMATLTTDLTQLLSDRVGLIEQIRATKGSEFHSLGLVLGYSYAGSPVVQGGERRLLQDPTAYVPVAEPGARLPHLWICAADDDSLYDHLGPGFTLMGPVDRDPQGVSELVGRASDAGVPFTVLAAPEGYPFADTFLLVRPDQHIAARADTAAAIDLELVTGRAPIPTH